MAADDEQERACLALLACGIGSPALRLARDVLSEGRMAQQKIAGTQSIARAFAILKVLARVGPGGIPLREVARSSGLTSATAHRILQQLIHQGAVMQRHNSDYVLGPLMSELRVSAFPRQVIIAACRPAMEALAAATQDTVFLIYQSGGDGICLDRIDATGAVRVITLEIGERRPLSDSAAGIAILASGEDDQVAAMLDETDTSRARYASDIAAITQRIRDARDLGHAFVTRDEVGVSAIGMAVPSPDVGLAISLSSTTARLTEPRLAQVREALARAVDQAGRRLSAASGASQDTRAA